MAPTSRMRRAFPRVWRQQSRTQRRRAPVAPAPALGARQWGAEPAANRGSVRGQPGDPAQAGGTPRQECAVARRALGTRRSGGRLSGPDGVDDRSWTTSGPGASSMRSIKSETSCRCRCRRSADSDACVARPLSHTDNPITLNTVHPRCFWACSWGSSGWWQNHRISARLLLARVGSSLEGPTTHLKCTELHH